MWYNVNFEKLVSVLAPTFMRKERILAYSKELITPVYKLHNKWKLARVEDWIKIDHNGQICKLRKILNDRLDPYERRIYLDEGNAFPRNYIYTRNESKPVFLGKMFIYQNSEYLTTGVDFIVYVTEEINEKRIDELTALLEFYKLASKRYQIRVI